MCVCVCVNIELELNSFESHTNFELLWLLLVFGDTMSPTTTTRMDIDTTIKFGLEPNIA